MKRFRKTRRWGQWGIIAVLAASVAWPSVSWGETLEEKLGEVSGDYAQAYLTPLINAFGANMNSCLYTSAHIGKSKIQFEIGFKLPATHLAEGDQTFRKYSNIKLNSQGEIDPNGTIDAMLEMSGPTVIGDTEVLGRTTVYVNGVPVQSFQTISGLWNTRWVPLPIPEASIGGIAGFRGTIRWFPSMELGDLGKLSYMGLGIQYGVNNLFPDLPLDVMLGYFRQDLDVGNVMNFDGDSFYLGLSKSSPMLTVYGGGAIESSKTTISYTWVLDDATQVPVEFEQDGIMESRLTIGATLTMGIRLNVEANIGKLAVYAAGLMFGF